MIGTKTCQRYLLDLPPAFHSAEEILSNMITVKETIFARYISAKYRLPFAQNHPRELILRFLFLADPTFYTAPTSSDCDDKKKTLFETLILRPSLIYDKIVFPCAGIRDSEQPHIINRKRGIQERAKICKRAKNVKTEYLPRLPDVLQSLPEL